MEFSSNSMGGVGALLLFWGEGAELSDSFASCWDVGCSDEDELYEEIELD